MNTASQYRLIAASSLSTILEWYDFALFAYLTPTIAKLFFPAENPITALMLTYSIFAIGFFVRPLGAILFGHCGDRYGRKKTLIATILLMSIPTFLIGVLPTYQSIGLAAPALLILLRVCQGLSVGGESTGAILYVMESVHSKKRGFISSILWSMTGAGMLLGSFAAMLVAYFPQYEWAWRVPFLLGLFTGLIIYYLRKSTLDSMAFLQAVQQKALSKFPLAQGIRKYKSTFVSIVGIYILSALITYLIFIFMPSYAIKILGMPASQATSISTLSFLASVLLVPFAGLLSDRLGKVNCLRWSILGLIFLSYPLFKFMAAGGFINYIVCQIIFIILTVGFQGAVTALIIDLLPTEFRYSITAVGYNLSYSIFGGTAPLIATYIVGITHDKAAPGLYLLAGALVALAALHNLTKNKVTEDSKNLITI